MRNTNPQAPSGLTRWIFPSIKDIIFLAFVFVPFLVNKSGVLDDADTGWHIRNGEHIMDTMSLPRTDYFSYTHAGRPWFAWEWLADVTMAMIHRITGLNGIVVWANLCFGFTFTLLFKWMLGRGWNIFLCLGFTVLAGFASAVHWLGRPHLFTLVLVLVWTMILHKLQMEGESSGAGNRRLGWSLPVLMLFWTNLHGGFVVGLILLLICALGNLLTSLTTRVEEVRAWARRLSGRFAWLAIVCFLVSLINPYGISVHKHIFDSYLHSQYLVDRIMEFASPNFHSLVVKFFELILLSSLIVAGISRLRLSFIEMGMILFWTHMALFSVRHVPLYSLIIAPIVTRHLSHYLTHLGKDQSIRPWVSRLVGGFNSYSRSILAFENQFRGWLYPVLSTIILMGVCLNHGQLGASTVLNLNFDDKRFPLKAAEFIDKGIPEGNLMTTDYWGGYVIYRFFPRIKVFFDGRNDMYGSEFLKEYEKLVNLDYSWKNTLSKYRIQWILLPVEYGLATALKELPEWRVIYDDHQAIIFVRRK